MPIILLLAALEITSKNAKMTMVYVIPIMLVPVTRAPSLLGLHKLLRCG